MQVMDERKFAIYRTIDVDVEDIIYRLGKGITGKENHQDMWHAIPDPFTNSTPTQIIHHHRSYIKSLNQSLLVIADRQDLDAQGLLIVNLNFKGSVDALRQKIFFAGDFVPSVNIGNTVWEETLSNATLPLYPRRRFAVFVDQGFHPRYLMREVLERMNAGLGNRRVGTGTVFAEWESAPGGDLGETVRFWRENAREREWDGRYSVLIRKDEWDIGKATLLLGGGGDGQGDVCQTAIDVERIGEVLVSLYVGLLTPDEVKGANIDF